MDFEQNGHNRGQLSRGIWIEHLAKKKSLPYKCEPCGKRERESGIGNYNKETVKVLKDEKCFKRWTSHNVSTQSQIDYFLVQFRLLFNKSTFCISLWITVREPFKQTITNAVLLHLQNWQAIKHKNLYKMTKAIVLTFNSKTLDDRSGMHSCINHVYDMFFFLTCVCLTYLYNNGVLLGCMATVSSMAASHLKVLGLNWVGLGLLFMQYFKCSLHFCMSLLWALWFPATPQKHREICGLTMLDNI